MRPTTCSVEVCSDPIAIRDLCVAHYARWKAKGDVQAHIPIRRSGPPRLCEVEDCERPHHSGGCCAMHHMRVRTTGSPGEAEYRRVPGSPGRTEKPCKICAVVKPLAEFPTDKRTRDGRGSHCRECMKEPGRQRTLRRKYGLTAADIEALTKKQHGRCPICREPRKLVVDHCHRSGRVRALLCDRCNRMLGVADDDVVLLRAAIRFLQKHSKE